MLHLLKKSVVNFRCVKKSLEDIMFIIILSFVNTFRKIKTIYKNRTMRKIIGEIIFGCVAWLISFVALDYLFYFPSYIYKGLMIYNVVLFPFVISPIIDILMKKNK